MSQTLTYVIGQDRRAHVDDVQNFKVNFDGGNSNWVQARQYERSMRQVFVNIKNEDGTPFDLTGCNVWFEGLLPKNSNGDFRIIDDKGYVALDPSAGRFRFDMPGHAFTVAGSYRQAFFRIIKDGNSLTTLEFDLDILADKVIDGLVPRTYISPVEELIDEIETKYQDSTDKLTKMASDFTDKFTQTMSTLQSLGTTVQSGLDALEQKIKTDGLFTQAEADAFKQTVQNKIDRINDAVGDVSIYGATGDGTTDDTAALQKVIDAFKSSGKTRLTFHGTYKMSKSGEDDDKRPYAIKVDGLENKIIDLTNAKFILDLTDDMPNVFAFLNCNDVTVVGGYAEANFKETEGHPLYYGSFIYGKSCTNLSIYRTHAHNMVYGVCLFDCSQGQVTGNKFTHSLIKYDRKFRPASAILLKDTTSYHVSSNDITGGLRDGDLSIFGAGCYANVVTSNNLRGLAWEEAITVDGGARKTIVSNNVIEGGYNYGIDVKFNSENTLVTGNTIEKCVVAIDDHGGEINAAAKVFQTIIHNNNIVFGNIPSTQGWGDHRQTGIGVNAQYAADIKGNHLTLGRGYDVDYSIYGIMASQADKTDDYKSQIDISNNFIELKNGINAAYQKAGKGSTAICLNTITQANITNNDIKAPVDDLAVMILGQSDTIKFSANHFITDGVDAIQYYGDAGCKNLIITDDNYYSSGHLTNAYMYQTTTGDFNRSFVFSSKKFGSAQANPFFFITSKYDSTVIVRVEMQHDDHGTFVISSTYKLTINVKDKMVITPIVENNADVELSSVTMSDNIFALCAKATRDCTEVDDQKYRVTVISSSDSSNVFA